MVCQVRDVFTVDAYLAASDVLEEVGFVGENAASCAVPDWVCFWLENLCGFVFCVAAVLQSGGTKLAPKGSSQHFAEPVLVEEVSDPGESVTP